MNVFLDIKLGAGSGMLERNVRPAGVLRPELPPTHRTNQPFRRHFFWRRFTTYGGGGTLIVCACPLIQAKNCVFRVFAFLVGSLCVVAVSIVVVV